MSIPTLKTERLVIREYTHIDLEHRHRLVQQSFGSTANQEDTRLWLNWTIAGYRELSTLFQPPYGDYAVVLVSTGEVIGSVGLVPSSVPWNAFPEAEKHDELVTPEFGLFWGILPTHWGRGYAPEATFALVNFCFNTLNIRRLVATTDHDNLNSQRVMKKLGMRLFVNTSGSPFWSQVVGVVEHPTLNPQSSYNKKIKDTNSSRRG